MQNQSFSIFVGATAPTIKMILLISSLPGKRLPKVVNGFARLRGKRSVDAAAAALLLVNMSNVKPGYKNGLMFGKKWSGVISSFSRRADSAGLQLDCNGDVDEIFLEGESLDNREETEKMLGVFFGIEVVPLLLLWIILVVAAVRLMRKQSFKAHLH